MGKKKTQYFFGRTKGGIAFSISFILIIIAIIIIGILFFDAWFYLVIGATTFAVADLYFIIFIDYETNCIYIPIFKKRTDDEFVIFAVYFVGVLTSGFAAFLSSFYLTLFKDTIRNFLWILLVSLGVAFSVAIEIKSGMSKKRQS